MNNFDSIFSNLEPIPCQTSIGSNFDSEQSFHIIRNVLSMLNGLNVETVKKNPNDIFMLLKYKRSDHNQMYHQHEESMDDEACQLIMRIGGLGKLLLKIINYLNYYNKNRKLRHHLPQTENIQQETYYPMFDDDIGGPKTLGNIKQYYVNSIYSQIKQYHYNLLLIESRFRNSNGPVPLMLPYRASLRRILIWSNEWMEKFLFLSDCLKHCIDLKGVSLLNAIYDQSLHGNPCIRKLARSILHQALKPFIYNMFDWLLAGDVSREISLDFFIWIKEESCTNQIELKQSTQDSSAVSQQQTQSDSGSDTVIDDFEWKIYELNSCQLPSFMSRLQIKKILFIGNAIRLLRYMIRDEYDQRTIQDIFAHSQIQIHYDTMKKFVYKSVDSYGSNGEIDLNQSSSISMIQTIDNDYQVESEVEPQFFFEHPLVDDFDTLLDSYYEVINDEMFKLLNMSELKRQFEIQLGFVLMQRGDFYESLIDYLQPLLRKPASEVVNIVNGQCTSLHRIFNMFMVNAKLIELSQVYKIDSLLYNNYEINDSMIFTFSKTPAPMRHHLGWDIFVTRYRFTKKVYHILFSDTTLRYERLFRQLFYFKRVMYSIRRTQRQVAYYQHLFKRRKRQCKLSKSIGSMLNILHFIFFHMFGFISRMYRHFGSQISSSWENVFGLEFIRKQKQIEKFVRAHERFLLDIEKIVFFNRDHAIMTAFSAVNDAILDFCETFAEIELFPTMESILVDAKVDDDFEELQAVAEQLFRHQFKIGINISKYRCCISSFIDLSQMSNNGFEFKYDIVNYQPCLDELFECHNLKSKTLV